MLIDFHGSKYVWNTTSSMIARTLGMMIGRRIRCRLTHILSKEEEDVPRQINTSPIFSTRFRRRRKMVCCFQLLELRGVKGKGTKIFPRRFIRRLFIDNFPFFFRNKA